MIRIGINGIGRIGKLVFRLVQQRDDMEVVAVNDPMPLETLVHLLKYDSIHGLFSRDIRRGDKQDEIRVNGHVVKKYAELHPEYINWDEHSVDVVIDSSGEFLDMKTLSGHLKPGVKKVILSCPPAEELDNMVVIGVNEHSLGPKHRIISNASCTTNCIAPVLKILDDHFGIDRAMMNTVHPYTNSQNVIDAPHKDLRRARCANENIIPTTTSAIKAVQQILPSLKGRFDGFASRVPVSDGSFVELNAILEKKTSIYEINELMHHFSLNQMSSILEYCEDPIVSKDIVGNPHSAVFDSLCTRVLGGDFIQILAWYDNEFAYSNRIIDLIKHLFSKNRKISTMSSMHTNRI